jgi:hypothetical protein
VVAQKGGSAKTTVVVHLAVEALRKDDGSQLSTLIRSLRILFTIRFGFVSVARWCRDAAQRPTHPISTRAWIQSGSANLVLRLESC